MTVLPDSTPAATDGPVLSCPIEQKETATTHVSVLFAAIAATLFLLPQSLYVSYGFPRYIQLVVVLWLIANIYIWAIPTWADRIITTRGPLGGFGFAVAASVLTALAAADTPGVFVKALGLRLLLLTWPFVLPLILQLLPGAPHLVDAVTFVYGVVLGLTGWLSVPVTVPSELLPIRIDIGGLTLIAAATTYFFGLRGWRAVSVDWRMRFSDYRYALQAWVLAASGVLALIWLVGHLTFPDTHPSLFDFLFSAIYFVGIVAVAEEFVFRAIVMVGFRYLFGPGNKGHLTAAALSAIIFGLFFGPTMTSVLAAVWMGLIFGWFVLQDRRVVPAVLAHGALLAVTYLLLGYAPTLL